MDSFNKSPFSSNLRYHSLSFPLFFVMSLYPEHSFINSLSIKFSSNHPNLNVPSVPRQDPDWASAYWPCSMQDWSRDAGCHCGITHNHVNDHLFPYSWSRTFSDTPMTFCLPASQGHHPLPHTCCPLENPTFSASSVLFPHQKLPPNTTSFFLRAQTLFLLLLVLPFALVLIYILL